MAEAGAEAADAELAGGALARAEMELDLVVVGVGEVVAEEGVEALAGRGAWEEGVELVGVEVVDRYGEGGAVDAEGGAEEEVAAEGGGVATEGAALLVAAGEGGGGGLAEPEGGVAEPFGELEAKDEEEGARATTAAVEEDAGEVEGALRVGALRAGEGEEAGGPGGPLVPGEGEEEVVAAGEAVVEGVEAVVEDVAEFAEDRLVGIFVGGGGGEVGGERGDGAEEAEEGGAEGEGGRSRRARR